VRRPNVVSPKLQRSSNFIPKSAQVFDNHGQIAADSGHIFKQYESGLNNSNDCCCGRPLVAFIAPPLAFSGNAEWLAWEAGGKDVNQSRIDCGIPITDECFDIAEDRCIGQDTITDSGGEDSLAIIVPFNISDGMESKEHRSEKSAASA